MTIKQQSDPVPVLMYHSVHADPAPGTERLSVHPAAFAAQLTALCDLGFTTITMAALVEHWRLRATGREAPGLPDRPVVLTFDDGYADFHQTVLPLLAEHRATASLYVTTGWLADAGPQQAGRPLGSTLSWGQLTEIAAEGVEIGGHSHSHPQLDQLPAQLLASELTLNQKLLEQHLQQPLSTFGYPFGYSDAAVRRAVHSHGYVGACAVANALADPRQQGPYALSRLTVRRGTTLADFRALVQGRTLTRLYARDRLLTRGYALTRRARGLLRTG